MSKVNDIGIIVTVTGLKIEGNSHPEGELSMSFYLNKDMCDKDKQRILAALFMDETKGSILNWINWDGIISKIEP